MKKLWVLAEPETFFLPGLVARLAEEGRVAGVIEISHRASLASKAKAVRRLIDCFGFKTLMVSGFAAVAATLLDACSSRRFFSLRKTARRFGIPYLSCSGFSDPALLDVLENRVKDAPVLVQVGRLVPAELTRQYQLINKHCSILPGYAGVFPVFWTLLNGEKEQGVTLHRMNERFDEGEILAQARVECSGSFFEIYRKLYDLSHGLIVQVLDGRAAGPSGASAKGSYYSYPTSEDRRRFESKGHRFGSPFRLK